MLKRNSHSIEHEMAVSSRLPTTDEATSHLAETETVARGGVAFLIASVVGNGLSYMVGILLARWLGAESFGMYALTLAIFNSLAIVMLGGMHTGALKFVSQYLGVDDFAKVKSTIILVLVCTLLSGVLLGAGLFLLAPYLAAALFHQPEATSILRLFAWGLPLAGLGTVLLAMLQSFQLVGPIILIKHLWEPLGKFLLVLGLLWAGWGLQGVVFATIFVLLISVLLFFKIIWEKARLTFSDVWQWEPEIGKSLLLYCLPLSLSNVFDVVAPRLDLFFLGLWSTLQDVGVYSAAFQTAAVLALILGAFNQIFSPVIGRLSLVREREKVQDLYQFVCRINLTVTIPLFLTLTVFSSEILRLFGESFVMGAPCLMVLAFGQVVNSSSGFASTILLMNGHSRLVLGNTIIFGGLLIGFAALLIPTWGIWGASLAAAVSHICISLTRVFQVWWLYQLHPYSTHLMKSIGAGLLCLIVLVFLKGMLLDVIFPALVIFGVGLYLGLLLMFKLHPTDRKIVRNLMKSVAIFRGGRSSSHVTETI